MANLLSTNVSGRLYTSEYVDTNVTNSAFRFYDGTTFRGGLGLDDWAHSGSAADITMYVAGAGTFYITTNSVKRHWFNGAEVAFRTYAPDLNYKTSFIGGDQLNAYYGAGSATLYVQYHNGVGGNFNVGNGKLTVDTNGVVVASGSLRAPIFYDSNDTTYYLDPNSSTSGYFAGTLRQNVGKYVRDSHYRTVSGYGDYYSGGNEGWTRVAEIRLTANCSGAVIFGTLYDHRYSDSDAYQISIVARADCDFTSNNESHYINVGCTIVGSTGISNYRDKVRVLLIESSPGSRKYEVQFYETGWNHNTWQLESNGWTILSSAEAPGASVGGERVNYMSNQNADNVRANSAVYAPIYYDSNNTSYYLDPNSITSIRTVGSWRADSSDWDGEYAGKIQYHGNWWYFQAYGGWIFRRADGIEPFYVTNNGGVNIFGSSETPINITGSAHKYITINPGNGYEAMVRYVGGSGSSWYVGKRTSSQLVGTESFHFYSEAAGATVGGINTSGDMHASGSMRAPIFYDSNDTGYYLDPNGTSNLLQLNTATRARWGMPRWWNDRSSFVSDQGYWTGTNGWGTGQGTWANAWQGGFSGWDIWGTGTDHPQGAGYVHAQGIVSGQHYANSSVGYGWMMVGAANATDNRYWLRGKWDTTTSGWVEMITTGNISSQSVSYASSAGNADTVDGYHESSFWRNDQNRVIGVLRFTGEGYDSGNGSIATSYGIYQQGGAWTYPYPDLCIGYHTGIKIGAHYGYGGTRFYNNSDWATEIFSVGDGDNNVRIADKLIFSSSNTTMISNGSMTDAIGYNTSYGTYIGSTVGGTYYIYGNGRFYDNGTIRTLIHSGNIGSQSVNYASSSGDADTVDNYHASSLWRSDGGNWNPGANITLYQTGNSQEWSFDIYRQGYTGGYWHVWDSSHGTMLGVDATNNYVWATGSFRAPIFYDSNDTNYYVNPSEYSYLWRTSTHIAPSPGVGSSNWVNDFNNTPVSSMSFGGDLSSGGPSGTWWFQQNMRHGNSSSSWGTQIAWGWEDNANELRQRNVSAGSWSNWTRYINTNNFQTILNPYYFSVPAWTTGTQTNVRSSYVTSGRWYRIANLGTERFFARVRIYDDSSGGPHSSVEFQVAGAYNNPGGYSFTMTSNGYYSAPSVTEVRILSAGTYDPQYLEVYINYVGYQYSSFAITLLEARNATLVNFDEGGVPSGYSRTSWLCNAPLATGGRRAIFNDGFVAYNDVEIPTIINTNRFDLESSRAVSLFGHVGRYVSTQSAQSNYIPFSFESTYGNHSWGQITRFHIQQSGADRPSIQFSSGSNNTRWNVGYCYPDDSFRITQNMGMRPDNSGTNDGWGTERFKINTDGWVYTGAVVSDNWFRPSGATGLYFSSYAYGIYAAEAGGSSYGNVATYGSGANSWPGYAISNFACLMAREVRRGIFLQDKDSWLIRYENSINQAVVDFELSWGSDIRYKSNVNTISSALEKVTSLRGVTYNYKGAEKTSIGFIAQEVEQVVPEVVSTDLEGYKSVAYANMVALLTEAIKEQQTIINDLKARIELLESK